MAPAPERIRQLTLHLVDELWDALVQEIRSAATAPASGAGPAPTSRPRADGGAVYERTIAFLRQRPEGATPRDFEPLSISRTALYRALGDACERGAVVKLGHGRAVRYRLASFDGAVMPNEVPVVEPAAARPRPPRANEDLSARLTDFVRANPGCRYSEIAKGIDESEGRLRAALSLARESGAIRMEGAKIRARYFPPIETPQAPVEVGALVPEQAAATSVGTPGAVERAEALISELDDAASDGQHDIRFGALLQAIVAEVRMLQPRVAPDHPVARRLDALIRRSTAIRAERDLPFIVGLKRDAVADWPKLVRDARRRVAKFDEDAGVQPAARRPTPQPARSTAQPTGKSDATDVEALPKLAALAAERSVVLVGGIKKNEVLDQVRRHHGVTVEWAAMQGANARAAEAFIDRIRRGKVGAVVVLEGLTGTTQVKSVVEACKTAGVPFAYGGRAGSESLRQALRAIEGSVEA